MHDLLRGLWRQMAACSRRAGALACSAVAIPFAIAACTRVPQVPDGTLCAASCETTLRYRLDPSFSDREREAIVAAMDIWHDGTGGRACFAPRGDELVFIRVSKPEELAAIDDRWQISGALHRTGTIWILAQPDPAELTSIAVHEIGHELGLAHTEAEQSIMRLRGGTLTRDGFLHEHDRIAYCAVHGCACGGTPVYRAHR